MTDSVDLEKTAPIILLENRRKHLMSWLAEGEHDIEAAQEKIATARQNAIDILKELDELEKALNVLNVASKEIIRD